MTGDVGFSFSDYGYCQTIDLNENRIIVSFMLSEGVANAYDAVSLQK